MPRRARIVLPGFPHHLTQRGVRRLNIFREPEDRDFYVEVLLESALEFGLHFFASCLMTNHVHHVVVPEREDSLWRTFHRTHSRYASWFNEKNDLAGYLFDDRPYSAPLDEHHLWTAVHYVECNPVRAGMVERAEDYPWSSAAAHCGLRSDPLIDLKLENMPESKWSEWLASDHRKAGYQFLRDRTFTGLPCGSETFVRQAEAILGRSFTPRKPGPKPKRSAEVDLNPTLWANDE